MQSPSNPFRQMRSPVAGSSLGPFRKRVHIVVWGPDMILAKAMPVNTLAGFVANMIRGFGVTCTTTWMKLGIRLIIAISVKCVWMRPPAVVWSLSKKLHTRLSATRTVFCDSFSPTSTTASWRGWKGWFRLQRPAHDATGLLLYYYGILHWWKTQIQFIHLI